MKDFYRRTVEKLSTGKAVFIAAMLVGAVIAIGEFLCTGQLVAATVLYYFDASAGNMMVGALIFLLYTGGSNIWILRRNLPEKSTSSSL